MKYGVGIDVSKGKSTVAILSIEGEVIEEPFEINHDINGLNLNIYLEFKESNGFYKVEPLIFKNQIENVKQYLVNNIEKC